MASGKFNNTLLVPILFVLVSAMSVCPARGAEPIKFSGEVSGVVSDFRGKPVPGATVLLFNKQDRLLQRVTADSMGSFAIVDLLPDLYSIRVSLSSFLPANRDHVLVRPGMRSMLDVSLSRLYSTIQIVSTAPVPGGLMGDNWKWALRMDSARRPVLRFLPSTRQDILYGSAALGDGSRRTSLFSQSRAMLKVSASDGAQNLGSANEADLGTQFAFATSVYGANRVQLSGNLGFTPSTGLPSAGFRTTYKRDVAGASPEISVTMRQLSVPTRVGVAMLGSPASDSSVPALRTLSASFADRTAINDSLDLQYGFELDMVSFLSRLRYFSPYAKMTYSIPHGNVDFTWTSGNARPELGMVSADANADLQRDLTALSLIPKVSLMDGNAKVQRGDDYELGLTQRYGSREYRVSAYREIVTNAALALSMPGGNPQELFGGDLLSDLFSNSMIFNAGRFESVGYTASVTQDLTADYKVSLAVGSAGVLLPNKTVIAGNDAEDLRATLVSRQRPSVTLRVSGTVKQAGTRFVTSYEWADSRSATPAQMYSTQVSRPEPGFNVYVRQPLPNIPGVPWRMEATADFRNLLAQGYLTLNLQDGQKLLLVPNPRSFRGGLAFVF